jgi:hypothetical protein
MNKFSTGCAARAGAGAINIPPAANTAAAKAYTYLIQNSFFLV